MNDMILQDVYVLKSYFIGTTHASPCTLPQTLLKKGHIQQLKDARVTFPTSVFHSKQTAGPLSSNLWLSFSFEQVTLSEHYIGFNLSPTLVQK